MNEYKKYIKQDQTGWLLERTNPSVRYFALKELLELNDLNTDVIDVQKQIMQSKPVNQLLLHQQSDGHWGHPGWTMHLPNIPVVSGCLQKSE